MYIYISFSVYWDYAMTIRLEEIVYLHCHQLGMYLMPPCAFASKIIMGFN